MVAMATLDGVMRSAQQLPELQGSVMTRPSELVMTDITELARYGAFGTVPPLHRPRKTPNKSGRH